MTEQRIKQAALIADHLLFTRYMFRHIDNKKFIVNWHHELLCKIIMRIFKGELKRVLIRMPPRYGKTEIMVKNFIAAGLAINPASKFIHLSYSADLALDNSEHVRNMITSDAYQEVFPYVQLDKASTAKKKWYTTDGGGVYATSTGGQITGFGAGAVDEYSEADIEAMCADAVGVPFAGAIVIDDPLKADDASSDVVRERINERFETTIRSRTNSRNTPIVVIGQALHENDLIGYLKALEPDEWELITLPALYHEDGEEKALWPNKHSIEDLHRLRKSNEYVFETQYQQNPTPKEGVVFPRGELNYYDIADIKDKKPDGVVMVCDIADEGADCLCAPVGFLYGEKVYIVDVVFTPDPVEITQPIVAGMIDKYKPDRTLFESNNGGKQYAQRVNDMITHRVKCKWKPTTKNKHTRILMKSGAVKENFYFRNDAETSEEYKRFLHELWVYTKDGKSKHDDSPDGVTMLAELTEKSGWGW